MMAKISLQTQLASMDAVIQILRRRQLPTASQCELLANHLGEQRDHLALTLAKENQSAENRYRTRFRARMLED